MYPKDVKQSNEILKTRANEKAVQPNLNNNKNNKNPTIMRGEYSEREVTL